MMRELRVEDALLYLDQVKMEFGDRPHIYNEFLDIMKTFKTQQIDTPGVIRRVSNLFQGNKKLVLGFNTFLPEGYKIELPLDGDGPPVAVYRAPGQPGVTHILGPNAPPVPAPAPLPNRLPQQVTSMRPPQQQQQQQQQQQPQRAPFGQKPAAAPVGMVEYNQQRGPPQQQQQQQQQQPRMQMPPKAPPRAPAPPPQQQQQQQQAQQQNQPPGAQPPVEFDHAINYVTTIKRRFAGEPETYKKFLEILHTYQKEQRGIKEVLDEVSLLFSEHPDLLKEFTYFLPDAVQAQAKAQLDQAAKESEARKRANASKQAIMQQAQGMQQAAAQQQPPRRPTPQQMVPPPQPQQQQQQPTPPQPQSPPQLEQQPPQQPPFASAAAAPVPFGAAQGRSDERERDICRSTIYGTVGFTPTRPPRRSDLPPAQASVKYGRPQTIPELPTQPTTAEAAFFERAKLHLNRKELAPDKPPGSRRHTPYTEFLKCLHLFGAGILNKEELCLLLRGLFMQGHAPKSGANAGGGASNPAVANDAQELLREFEEILVGRGHFADQENTLKDNSKYGDKQVRDFEFSGCEKPTPSYRSLPSDYPLNLFHSHSGQSGMDASVLNNSFVCVPPRRGPRMVWSPDEYDGPAERNNVYEENMFKVEDERYETDLAIERNTQTMRIIEPIAEEITRLRETEEKDGQPIGRMHYKFRPRQLRCDQVNAIARLYGDHGDEVLQHLKRNPVAVLPIVYQRARQKDGEWRKAKTDMSKRWNTVYETNYLGTLDTTCWENMRYLEKLFDEKKIVKELKNARTLAKEPGHLASNPATADLYPKFSLGSVDPRSLIYQAHISMPKMVLTSKNPLGEDRYDRFARPHKDAYQMIAKRLSFAKSKEEQQIAARVWVEIICPMFKYPTNWFLNELREFTQASKFSIVKYGVGQKVVTAYGEGEILSIVDATQQAGMRYRVALPYGTGFIRPESILHVVPGSGNYARSNHRMQTADLSMEGSGRHLDSNFTLLFGTQTSYTFLRLYSLLVIILDGANEILHLLKEDTDNMEVDSSSDGSTSQKDGTKARKGTDNKNGYSKVTSSLKKTLSDDMTRLDFERVCRNATAPEFTWCSEMAVLPKLVEKCADLICKLGKDDTIFKLHDYSLMKEDDPVKIRSHCLATAENACFRTQIDRAGGWVCFSYVEPEQELLAVPEFDDADDEGQEEDVTGDELMGDERMDTGQEDGDDTEDAEDGELEEPDAKRPKIK